MPEANNRTKTITLEEPILMGDTEVRTFTLRRPTAGELRGLKLGHIVMSDYDTIEQLIPRISSPTLHRQHVAQMCPADIVNTSNEIVDFFLSSADRAGLSKSTDSPTA